MSKRKPAKSKTARGIRNLPSEKPSAKQARDVKGGSFLAGFKAGVTAGAKTPTHDSGDLLIIKKVDKSSPM